MKAEFAAPSGVIRRSGEVVVWNAEKIRIAIAKAFLNDAEGKPRHSMRSELSQSEHEQVEAMTDQVVVALSRRDGAPVRIEDIQDQVELALMRGGEHQIARDFVLYREARRKARAQTLPLGIASIANVTVDGKLVPFDRVALLADIIEASEGFPDGAADANQVLSATERDLYEGIPADQVLAVAVKAACEQIERDPAYNRVAARLQLAWMRRTLFGRRVSEAEIGSVQREAFPALIAKGIAAKRLDPLLAGFDLARLAAALDARRDRQFAYLGVKTLYDRYFVHVDDVRIELPQTFFMRVAMGLAIGEDDSNARAIEFYNVLSSFDFMSASPTLFNSGTTHAQLSSCFLSTIPDELLGIFEGITKNAMLSKWAGGLGNDWTPVRALGSRINGTNGKSQGIVPFLKIANDTAVAVDQGGKRAGALCTYLETWHLDIEEFLELRKNTGDERRRTHDMHTANWIPDLFMKRVEEGGQWTLFSPSEVPDLHDLYGRAFEAAYVRYEQLADEGKLKPFKRVQARDLWRKMLSMLFETGHPWITFKDPCNIRSPQQHVGVVHSSNLCSEITLNTSREEVAVCNLGSVNLVNHLDEKRTGLDLAKLERTVRTAMRMLDNVIDLNLYPVEEAARSNRRHRPVGLGLMGFQDALQAMGLSFASEEAVRFADRSTEAICYYAYRASSALAKQRGCYETYEGSHWSKGILPPDTVPLLAKEREGQLQVNFEAGALDWQALRSEILCNGMRNSNCVAIAPTATISNIIGVSASIEPNYQNLYVKSNLSGEFTVVNEYLVTELKAKGLWDDVMVADLKHFDGSVQSIDRVPDELKERFRTAFEIEPLWLIEAASRRQRWIDQAQSLNLFIAGASGRAIDEMYRLAWKRGLKTTYYLRTLGASSVEKSTGQGGELQAVRASPAAACTVGDDSCQSCQ